MVVRIPEALQYVVRKLKTAYDLICFTRAKGMTTCGCGNTGASAGAGRKDYSLESLLAWLQVTVATLTNLKESHHDNLCTKTPGLWTPTLSINGVQGAD